MTMSVLEARELSRTTGLAGPDPKGSFIRFAMLTGFYMMFASIGLAFASTEMWLAISVINGLILFGFAIGGHEAVHGSVSSSRPLNNAAGILWMGLLLLPFGTYSRMHIEHHGWVNTDKDPEGNFVYKSIPSFFFLSVFFGASFILVVWFHTITAAIGRSPYVRTAGQQRRITRQGAMSFVVVGALVASAVLFPPMRWLWFAPMLVGVFWWAPLILTPEHYALGPGDPAATSRTTKSNRIIRAVLWNVDFHTAHHLAPAVPARHLPAFNDMLEANNTVPETTSGYLRFQLDILKALLHRDPMLIPESDGATA